MVIFGGSFIAYVLILVSQQFSVNGTNYYSGRFVMATADPLFDFFTGYRYTNTMKSNQINFIVVTSRHSDVINWDIGFTVDELKADFSFDWDGGFRGNIY